MNRRDRDAETVSLVDGFWYPIFARYGGEAKWAAEAGVRVDRDPVTGARVFVDIRIGASRVAGVTDTPMSDTGE